MSAADSDVFTRITGLVEEEHQLRESGHADTARLRQLEEQLDQCWDLLRQRRARQEFGQNADEAQVRPAQEVEGYLQ